MGIIKKHIKTLLMVFTLSALILSACSTSGSEFTADRWAYTEAEKRHLMVGSLQEKYDLIGMNMGEVEELLGSPDYVIPEIELPDKSTERTRYEYIIKDDPIAGRRVLVFVIENDTLAEVFEDWEDW